MATVTGTEFPMGGVTVKFPYKPYPPQKAMMSKIIKALSNSENALLESPTGSGKSLALLCSALAWQKNACTQLVQKKKEERMKVLACTCKCHAMEATTGPQSVVQLPNQQPPMVNAGSHTQPLTLNTSAGIGTVNLPIIISSTPPVSQVIHIAPVQGTSASFGKPMAVELLLGSSVQVLPGLSSIVTLAASTVKAMTLQLPQMLLSNVASLVGGNVCSGKSATGLGDASKGGTLSTGPKAGLSVCADASTGGSVPSGTSAELGAVYGASSVSTGPSGTASAFNEDIVSTEASAGTSKGEDGTMESDKAVKVETQTLLMEETAAKDSEGADGDFKPSKKRFRRPAAAKKGPLVKKRKGGAKGVEYENDIDSDKEVEKERSELATSPANWKMEFNTPGGVAPGLGIPQSQIMDTGVIKAEACGGSSGMTCKMAETPVMTCGVTGVAPRMTSGITGACGKTGVTTGMTSGMTSGVTSKATCGMTFTSPVLPSSCQQCNCAAVSAKNNSPDRALRAGYSKIYFATRTHKQITQIARELRKSAYHDTQMCILGSRDHACIHPKVSKSKTKTDDCRKLLDYDQGVSCPFFHRVQQKMGSQAQLRKLGLTTAWDIEDLLKLGKKVKACPYYATRSIVEEADIVFCPYNYLIDPIIRDQMQIDLANKIIILDEAHNIEDNAREAASLSITSEELTEVTEEIQEILPLCRELFWSYEHLNALILAILRWITMTAETLPTRGYEQAFGVWNGQDFLSILDGSFGITEVTLETYKSHLTKVTEAALEKNNDHDRNKK